LIDKFNKKLIIYFSGKYKNLIRAKSEYDKFILKFWGGYFNDYEKKNYIYDKNIHIIRCAITEDMPFVIYQDLVEYEMKQNGNEIIKTLFRIYDMRYGRHKIYNVGQCKIDDIGKPFKSYFGVYKDFIECEIRQLDEKIKLLFQQDMYKDIKKIIIQNALGLNNIVGKDDVILEINKLIDNTIKYEN
jgi:hypothetical protein